MANIYNPTDVSVEVTLRGVTYVVEAQSTLKDVPEEDARKWVEEIHQFLEITDSPTPAPTKVAVKEKEEVVEAAEDQEVAVETPKRKGGKK